MPKPRIPKKLIRKIEKTKKAGKLEAAFYVGKDGRVRHVSEKRTKHEVNYKEGKKGDRADAHTHPILKKSAKNERSESWPGPLDLANQLSDTGTTKLRTFWVVSTNRKGKVIGAVRTRATKKAVGHAKKKSKKYRAARMRMLYEHEEPNTGPVVAAAKKGIKKMKKMGFKVDVIPKKGYRMGKRRFKKKK